MRLYSTKIVKPEKLKAGNNEELLNKLRALIENGGPQPDEYIAFDALIQKLQVAIQNNLMDQNRLNQLLNHSDCFSGTASIIGHSRRQPFGYPGDYVITDRIYTWDSSERYRKWDHFTLSRQTAVAQRNRKKYFEKCIHQYMPGAEGMVLNIGSGPGRELYSYYTNNKDSRVVATCVEMEEKAISYARKLNEAFAYRICFVPMNIFRYETMQTFHLIWSDGLFDYLNDAAYVTLLRKCRKWLKPDGQIVIANFNADHSPGRAFREIFCNWKVNYRTPDQLIDLALDAGFNRKKVAVDSEPDHLNLYLKITG